MSAQRITAEASINRHSRHNRTWRQAKRVKGEGEVNSALCVGVRCAVVIIQANVLACAVRALLLAHPHLMVRCQALLSLVETENLRGGALPEKGNDSQKLHCEAIRVMPDLHTLNQTQCSCPLETVQPHDVQCLAVGLKVGSLQTEAGCEVMAHNVLQEHYNAH